MLGTLKWYILAFSANWHLKFSGLSQEYLVQKYIRHFYDFFLDGGKDFLDNWGLESKWNLHRAPES